MPRRRATNRSTSSNRKSSGNGKPRPFNRADGKVVIPDTRDKIMLDEDESEDNRDTDEYVDDEEVFPLTGMEEEGDDIEYENDRTRRDDDEDEDEENEKVKEIPARTKKARKSKSQKASGQSSSSEESESEDETWGRTKSAYYSSNAAEIESDDEEGNELEEQEAKRLQGKLREGMGEQDFGLGDSLDLEDREEAEDIADAPPPVTQIHSQDKKVLIRHLEKNSPETLALARDWDDAARSLTKTRARISQIQSEDPDALTLGMIHLHYQALLTYTTTLAFYFYLRSSEKYAQRPELLKAHPILSRLLTLKQSLTTLIDLDFAVSDSEGSDEEDENVDKWSSLMKMDSKQLWNADLEQGLDSGELDDILNDALSPNKLPTFGQEKPQKKKRKTAEQDKSQYPVFDLVEPEFSSHKPSSSRVTVDGGMADAFGEVTSLEHADALDKNARKKSLRFHTSKIESASARRQGARNQAAGGDDDLPYRERRKDKEARLAKEAKAKIKGQGGEDLDDTEPQRRAEKRPREDDSGEDEADDADGYYELIKKKSKQQKEQKKADYEALQAAVRPDIDDGGSGGPRSLTRAILANKGLTPHRPKSVRNPRVKKRQKFEKAKKKISSQKATYKGGIADTGRYDGEKSGISKVIKSVRLG